MDWKRVKKMAASRGMNTAQLATRMDMNSSTLWRRFAENRWRDRKFLDKLGKALELPLSVMLGVSEDEVADVDIGLDMEDSLPYDEPDVVVDITMALRSAVRQFDHLPPEDLEVIAALLRNALSAIQRLEGDGKEEP